MTVVESTTVVPAMAAEVVSAESVPPKSSFNSLGLDSRLTRALAKMDLEEPTLVQEQVIPIALTGRDVLAKSPTGSGKTLAYILPVLHKILATADGEELDKDGDGGFVIQAMILVPTKELAVQVSSVVDRISRYCTKDTLRCCNLVLEDSLSLQKSALQAIRPNLLISTPSRVIPHLASGLICLQAGRFQTLVLDEADLILSFGFQSDLDALLPHLPKLFQSCLFSATLSDDLDDLKALLLHSPAVVRIEGGINGVGSEDSSALTSTFQLKQYSIPATGEEKFLFTYVTLKLNLLRGKILIFCNSTERAYKLKLFLDQFGVKTGVLNPELPLTSRHGIVEQFNRSAFDVLIAADSNADAEVEAAAGEEKSVKKEGGVGRGIDFHRVDVVFNFDFPRSLTAYTHRVGRTARGQLGRGTAVSLIDESCDSREALEQVREAVKLTNFPFPLEKLEAFRYRCVDALRATTKHAIKRARVAELSRQILASARLQASPSLSKDFELLRNDFVLGKGIRIQPHMKHLPEYLLSSVGAKEVRPRLKRSRDEEEKKQQQPYNSTALFDHKRALNKEEANASAATTQAPNQPQVLQAPADMKLPQAALNHQKHHFSQRGKQGHGGKQKNRKSLDPLKHGGKF